MTSLHQPIDMGMIRSFKCIYRRYQLRALLKEFDSHVLTSNAKFSTTKFTGTILFDFFVRPDNRYLFD